MMIPYVQNFLFGVKTFFQCFSSRFLPYDWQENHSKSMLFALNYTDFDKLDSCLQVKSGWKKRKKWFSLQIKKIVHRESA